MLLTEIPEVITYKKEVTKQGKKFKFMSEFPSATEADYYIKVGKDSDINFVTWKHFYINSLDYSIKIYNIMEDEKINLTTWRNQ